MYILQVINNDDEKLKGSDIVFQDCYKNVTIKDMQYEPFFRECSTLKAVSAMRYSQFALYGQCVQPND